MNVARTSFDLVVILSLSIASARATMPAGDRLEATLRAEHQAGRFDGVALVAKNETLLGEYAFGEANRAFAAPHRVDEAFPVASVTKQWLAVMILQKVDQGVMNLDDPLARHLPQIDRPWAQTVTLRHLLSHTSGLPQPDAVIPDFYQHADLATSALDLAKRMAEKDPVEAPGKTFSYNNTDYIYLAAVIEAVSGKTLAQAIREAIAVPAGMTRTGLIVGREVIAGLPEDYDLDAGEVKVAPHYELANFSGAGAGYSTARDLWAFDRAMMAGTLLKPATMAEMLDSSPQTGYAGLGCWIYPLKFADGKTLRIVERHGGIGGYNVVNLYIPETGVCIILASNISTFTDPQTWNRQGLAYELLKQVVEGEGGKSIEP